MKKSIFLLPAAVFILTGCVIPAPIQTPVSTPPAQPTQTAPSFVLDEDAYLEAMHSFMVQGLGVSWEEFASYDPVTAAEFDRSVLESGYLSCEVSDKSEWMEAVDSVVVGDEDARAIYSMSWDAAHLYLCG